MHIQLLSKEEFQWIKFLTVKINTMAKIRIKQVKSAIHRPVDQKATLIALGIRKMNHSVEHETSVYILGTRWTITTLSMSLIMGSTNCLIYTLGTHAEI